MKLIQDDQQFNSQQQHVVREILVSLRNGLHEAGITDDRTLRATSENLAFVVAAIVDGSRIMKHDGKRVWPVLTFLADDDEDALICARSNGSWMHELVFEVSEEVFRRS